MIKKAVHICFCATISAHPDRSLLIQIGHDDLIGVPSFYRHLINPDCPDVFGWGMGFKKPLHVGHFHASDLIPAQSVKLCYLAQRHLTAHAAYACFISLCEPLRGGKP
jgi:hypothetical protein